MPDFGHLLPHERLLVTLAQRTDVRGPVENASLVLTNAGSRERFFRLARELGVEGLLLSALRQSPVSDLPPDVMRELDARWEHLHRQAILWDLERERVLHALYRTAISPVLLKGSALREVVYHDPTERSMGDLDLLVPSEEIETALAALREKGYASDPVEVMEAYREHHFHYRLTHPRGFIVELHWALAGPGPESGLNTQEFVSRSMTSQRGNNLPVRVPSFEDLLLHVVSQNAADAFGLLRRVADLDRILAHSPQLDWDYLARSAKKAGLDMALAVSLRLAELLLGAKVPAAFVAELRLSWTSRINIAMLQPVSWVVSLPADRRPAAVEVLRLWSATPWAHRLRLLANTARGSNPLDAALAGRRTSREGSWRNAGAGLLRLAKLAAYQLQVYSRSGLAFVAPSRRTRLRFWGT